jgi:2-polyprenyl-3-methyl-5-hydroxy-6-metoxy-1,4-benzoquinol methylase
MDLREQALHHTGRRHPWEVARFAVVRDLLENSLGTGELRGTRLLDIGCGDGYVAERLARECRAAHIDAVDAALGADQAAAANRRFAAAALSVMVATSLDPCAAAGRYDAVLLLDVLEHVADDSALLAALARHPGVAAHTRFIITVPAYPALFSRHDTFLGHHRRYTVRRLTQTAERAGLEVLETGYFFMSLLLPRLLEVARERVAPPRESGSGLATWTGGAVSTALTAAALRADYRVACALRRLGISLPGLSCFLVARRAPGVS